MFKATRQKATRLKAAHAQSHTLLWCINPCSLSVTPSPHPGHSEASRPPPTPLIGPNPPEEIYTGLNMLADQYQGDDQPVGETEKNIPSEDDDRYGMDKLVAQYDGYMVVCIQQR